MAKKQICPSWNQKESFVAENRAFLRYFLPQNGKVSSSNHPFSGAFAVSFREGKYTHFNQFIDFNQWLLVFFCKGSWVFVYFRVDQPGGPAASSISGISGISASKLGWRKEGATLEGRLETWVNSETKNRHGFNFSSTFHVTLCQTQTVFHFFFCLSRWNFSIKFPDFREWFESFFPMKGTFSWVCCFCAKNTKKDNLLLSTLAPFPSHQLGKSSSFRGW